jgi:hypothetical protein
MFGTELFLNFGLIYMAIKKNSKKKGSRIFWSLKKNSKVACLKTTTNSISQKIFFVKSRQATISPVVLRLKLQNQQGGENGLISYPPAQP